MAYVRGVKWTDEKKIRIQELLIRGLTRREAAQQLSKEFGEEITWAALSNACDRYGFAKYLLPEDKTIEIYKELTLPYDDYMISCDHHAPYFSELWVNRKLVIADKFGIKKNIEVGDLFDFDFIKMHKPIDGEKRLGLDGEVEHCNPLIKALDYFDENNVLRGNHEWRASRYTDSKIQARHLFGIFGAEIWKKKFKYSVYDKMMIGKKWMLVHPQSYSQISGSTAVRLAEKFHRHVLNAHGHFIALRYDRSGKYMGIDLGGMFDKSKISYINLQTTTHPIWNNGFGMIYDGHFYHFHEGTDWKYWLGK